LSALDHLAVVLGCSFAAFFAGWFCEWLRFGKTMEEHKRFVADAATAYHQLDNRRAALLAMNEALTEAVKNRDEQLGKHAAEVGKLYTVIQGLRNENANVREVARLTGEQLKAAKLRPLPDSRADKCKGVAAMVKDELGKKKRARKQ